jgi:hypothetical protein
MATKKLSVIERAEQRLAEEERQHELGADNRYDLHYWAAYLDGAREQLREDKSKMADTYYAACLDGRVRAAERWLG